MSYQINILRRAQKSLSKLPHDEYERIKETIQSLATTLPHPSLPKHRPQSSPDVGGRFTPLQKP